MPTVDHESLARDAGLTYVGEHTPGLRRVRRGRGFSYHLPDGRMVDEHERHRIETLAIPPAWRSVWIAADPAGHIQATGIDGAGRKQYIYHPVWEDVRDEVKFERTASFGRRLARLRKGVDADLRRAGLPREKVVALAVAVMDRTLIRVGNRRYAQQNDSYGLTTLTHEHVEISGVHVHLEFEGKSGTDHEVAFRDRRLAGLIARCQALSGETLFSYETANGVAAVSSADVNRYIAQVTKGAFTAKDFRTWGASSLVAGRLAVAPPGDRSAVIDAIDDAADRLGNTRAVCRNSYVHPVVIEAFADGTVAAEWRSARQSRWLDRSDSLLNRVLARCEPGRSASR